VLAGISFLAVPLLLSHRKGTQIHVRGSSNGRQERRSNDFSRPRTHARDWPQRGQGEARIPYAACRAVGRSGC
jgi:hypothetical protein